MHLLRRFFSASRRHDSAFHHRHSSVRGLYDSAASIRCPRDRGLDYAVARERHLKPAINLKDLIISEPSKSAPLSLLTQSKETLQIPFRPIEFVRKYPSIFQEFCPGSLSVNPHVKLTPEVISLSSEEGLIYQSVNYKQDIACRLLKLLMIAKVHKVPIFVLERLKWELGLPQDYETSVIPEFPDYFRVIDGGPLGGNWKMLELVCWSDEFSVSEMEKKGDKNGKIHFSLQYSKDFEMDKKYKKWADEWQKLPYVSPYENAMHLAAKTDESDKWAVAMLHELLSLFVGNKADRENLLSLGEFFGLRSRFKLAFLQHPGIFYVSSKVGMHTVVLREAYKRGILIERHPLMDMRFKYVQLMNVVKDELKSEITQQQKTVVDTRKGEEELEDEGNVEEDDSEMEDLSDDNEEDDDEEEEEEDDDDEAKSKRRRFKVNTEKFEDNNPKRSSARRANGESSNYNDERGSAKRFSNSKSYRGDQGIRGMALRRSDRGENATTRESFKRQPAHFEDHNPNRKNVARSLNGQSRNENDDDDDDDDEEEEEEEDDDETKSKRRRFKLKTEKFEDNNPKRCLARRANGQRRKGSNYNDERGSSIRFSNSKSYRGDQGIRGMALRKSNRGENATTRESFKRQPAHFKDHNPKRKNVTRSLNGQSRNENDHDSSTRFSKQTNARGDRMVSRRTPRKWAEDENATNRERFKRQTATSEGKNFKRSTATSQNGRSTNDSTCESSTRFSRNIRREQSRPRRTSPS